MPDKVVVTGAAGFIGSVLAGRLNADGEKNLVLVDDFSKEAKRRNYIDKEYAELVERTEFDTWLEANGSDVSWIIHIGARTDTTEFDQEIFDRLNLNYTKMVWQACAKYQIPLVYASSAATYGLGEYGYGDTHEVVSQLEPLNPYGHSKNDFDKWALTQESTPPNWYGLKFFNVYGPNEYHKGRMASVIWHTFNQIQKTGAMKLFRSHNPEYKNGEQLRDFIYVKDVVSVIRFLMTERPDSGLYNLGTGEARTFLDLAKNTFKALDREADISFIDTPADIRDKYQYFTEADMSKLIAAGYEQSFFTLEEGVKDYVRNYLATDQTA